MNKLIFLAIGVIFLVGCAQELVTPSATMPVPGNEDVEERVVIEESPQGSEPEQEQPEPKEVVKRFTMTASKWEFEPSTITVNKGDKVIIEVTSIDVTHGFLLQEFNIEERLEPNKPVLIEFIADKTGTFTFKCNVPCGSGHSNMKGTLIVK